MFQRIKPTGIAGKLDLPGANGVNRGDRQRRSEGKMAHRAMRQQRVAITVVFKAADRECIELEVADGAVAVGVGQRRKELSVRVNSGVDDRFAGAMNEHHLVSRAGIQRQVIENPVKAGITGL